MRWQQGLAQSSCNQDENLLSRHRTAGPCINKSHVKSVFFWLAKELHGNEFHPQILMSFGNQLNKVLMLTYTFNTIRTILMTS